MSIPHLASLLLIELGVLVILFLHALIIYAYGTPRMRRTVDAVMNTGHAVNNFVIAFALLGVPSAFLTVQLLQMLGRLPEATIPFWLEVAVQGFGAFSIVTALVPILLAGDARGANSFSLMAVVVLALGTFCGNIFKFLLTTGNFGHPWIVWMAVGFVTSTVFIVALLLFTLWRRRAIRSAGSLASA